MKPDYNKKLQAEREKLNRLVDEALKKGVPVSRKKEITRQCKKVNEMIMEMKRGEGVSF
jgi:hypothetical protein